MFDDDYDISQGTNYNIPNQELAIDDFNKAIEINPNAESYIKRAHSKIAQNLSDKRKRDEISSVISHLCEGVDGDISKAIAIDPSYSEAYYLQAHCNDRRAVADADSLLKDYSKAIELNPKNIHAYYSRALVKKYQLKDESGALEDLNKAIEIAVSNPYSFERRAVFKEYGNDNRGAIEDYEQAIKLYQDRGHNHHIDVIKSKIRGIKSDL